MPIQRDHPYMQFNFLVDLGDGDTAVPAAGFEECSQIGMEITIVEYRNGNDRENNVRKLPGLTKTTDVTLKRGLIGASNLYAWINDVRNGGLGTRNVVIQLQNEDHSEVVQTWKLLRARIVKHVSGPLNAKSTDVAMEEIVLAYERLEID